MTINFTAPVAWSRFETWLLDSKRANTILGKLLWNLHTRIWAGSIIQKALKDVQIGPIKHHRNSLLIAAVFKRCHFEGTGGIGSKRNKIESALKPQIQLARIVQTVTPLQKTEEPKTVSMSGPGAVQLIRDPIAAIFSGSSIGQKSAEILCNQFLPLNKIESITTTDNGSTIDFEITLKSEESTPLPKKVKDSILASLGYWKRLPAIPILNGTSVHIKQKIRGTIDLENSKLTFDAQNLTGSLTLTGVRTERSLISIQQIPVSEQPMMNKEPQELKALLLPVGASLSSHLVQYGTHKVFQEAFGNFSWPSQTGEE